MTVTDHSPGSVMQTALAAHDAGLSIIPIRSDGSKKPPFAWKQYQTERADKAQLRKWFAPGMYEAAAVVCGEVSGWLVMVEMEGWAWDQDLWQSTFRPAAVESLGEDRWAEITRYIERSPSGGVHFYVRCPGFEIGNEKLAMREHDGKRVVAMETRGQGGYSVIAPSVGHATGQPWEVAQGVLSDICEVTHDELDAILDAAGTLHQESPDRERVGEPSSVNQPADASPGPLAPSVEVGAAPVGDGEPLATVPASTSRWMDAVVQDFNESTSVLAWLPDWTVQGDDTYEGEHVTRLKRVGSDNDHGAVLFDSGMVGFFSSNCPRWAEPYDGRHLEVYDAFTIHMLEDLGTNAKDARVARARQLRAEGFGPAPLEQISASDETPESPREGGDEVRDEDAPAPGLVLRWVEDALANMPPEPEALLTNLLRRGEVTVLGAPRAIGKTWASLNLATILARGEGELFGSDLFTPVGPRRVLYLQGELGEWGSATRWEMTQAQATKDAWPERMVAETFERVRIRTTHRKVTTVDAGTVFEDSHVDAVVDHRLEPAIVEGAFDVLVIDPWATFFAGAENSNDETEAAIVALTDIARRCNIAVWIVHHISAKTQHSNLAEPEDLWRGASRLADAVSTRVTVLPHYTPADAKKAGLSRLDARKLIDIHVLERNGPPVPTVHAQREGVWWNAWEPPKAGKPTTTVTQAEVLAKLNQAPGKMIASRRALAEALGKHHSALDAVLPDMISVGVIETVPGARGAVGYRMVG